MINSSMFKAILLSQWYKLSDMGLEEALRVRLDLYAFMGVANRSEIFGQAGILLVSISK